MNAAPYLGPSRGSTHGTYCDFPSCPQLGLLVPFHCRGHLANGNCATITTAQPGIEERRNVRAFAMWPSTRRDCSEQALVLSAPLMPLAMFHPELWGFSGQDVQYAWNGRLYYFLPSTRTACTPSHNVKFKVNVKFGAIWSGYIE